MGQVFRLLPILGLFAATAFAQNIATPVFVHKDGDATATTYSGTGKAMYVDGGSQQSVGWITFQTEGVDVSKIASATLALYVNTLTSPGTLQVRLLTSDITAPENNVRLAEIPASTAITGTQALGTADVEKVIRIDLTAVVKSGAFKGVALTSDDGLAVAFDTKEGHLAPMLLLTNNVDDVTAKWHSGTGDPASGTGKDGDYYLNTVSGDVFAKASGTWTVVTNIVGATGATGPQGASGRDGANGHSPATTSTSTLFLASSGTIDVALDDNRKAFRQGQRIRLSSTANGSLFMEGTIGSYDEARGIAKVNLDYSEGRGLSISSWNAVSAGVVGAQGVQGIQGLPGAPGAQGIQGLPGPTGSFPSGNAAGDMQYWSGTAWVMIPAGQPGQSLSMTGSKIPQWSTLPGTVSDIDGNVYKTVVIGNQEWTISNLKTTRLNDGTPIPAGPLPSSTSFTNAEWAALTTPGYCWWSNVITYKEKCGALYNWYAVNTGKLAPAGWRVPTNADWTDLESFLTSMGYNYDGSNTVNKIAKSMAGGVWNPSTTTGAIGNNLSNNNKSNFSAIPTGYRFSNGMFIAHQTDAYWWSSTEIDASSAFSRSLNSDEISLSTYNANKVLGFSVRLVRE
jgi:uncharacterized protein (TIGR02145 family)